jgi:uncharacterized protein
MHPIVLADRLLERKRPSGAFVMHQRWAQLLFLHWSFEVAEIQASLPPGLLVDSYQGRAWLGLIPFMMQRVRPRYCPPVPGLSDFLELNVRTYVTDAQGRPGVWFYSLDANQALAVRLAQTFFHLPYHFATMQSKRSADSGQIEYTCLRLNSHQESRIVYRPTRSTIPRMAAPETLPFFLVERYRLFAYQAETGRLFTGQVHHAPYELEPAEVSEWDDHLCQSAGFSCQGRAPEHVCFAESVEVTIWPLKMIATAS